MEATDQDYSEDCPHMPMLTPQEVKIQIEEVEEEKSGSSCCKFLCFGFLAKHPHSVKGQHSQEPCPVDLPLWRCPR